MLRSVTETDRQWLLRLFETTREDLASLPLPAPEKATLIRMQFEAQSRAYASRFGTAGRAIVEHGGQEIGQVWVHRSDDEIRLVDIAFVPEHRGAGHGTALLEALRREARERGVPLRLSVHSWNRARRLYERLGFRRIGSDEVYQEMELSS